MRFLAEDYSVISQQSIDISGYTGETKQGAIKYYRRSYFFTCYPSLLTLTYKKRISYICWKHTHFCRISNVYAVQWTQKQEMFFVSYKCRFWRKIVLIKMNCLKGKYECQVKFRKVTQYLQIYTPQNNTHVPFGVIMYKIKYKWRKTTLLKTVLYCFYVGRINLEPVTYKPR